MLCVSDEPSELTPLRRNLQQQSPVSSPQSLDEHIGYTSNNSNSDNNNSNSDNNNDKNNSDIYWHCDKMTETDRSIIVRLVLDFGIMLAGECKKISRITFKSLPKLYFSACNILNEPILDKKRFLN